MAHIRYVAERAIFNVRFLKFHIWFPLRLNILLKSFYLCSRVLF